MLLCGISLSHQILAAKHLGFLLEQRRPDGRVALIERVHRVLDEHLVHIVEEIADALIVAVVVHHHEARLAGGHEGGHEPLVELVNRLQVHVVGFPLVLVDQIEGGVRDKLVQMAVVLLLCAPSNGNNTNYNTTILYVFGKLEIL